MTCFIQDFYFFFAKTPSQKHDMPSLITEVFVEIIHSISFIDLTENTLEKFTKLLLPTKYEKCDLIRLFTITFNLLYVLVFLIVYPVNIGI